MYTGHAALALYTRSRRRTIPLTLLLAVAFGPDWVEWIIGAKGHGEITVATLVSHSIPAVAIGAVVVAAVYALGRRGTPGAAGDALALFALYASHWIVDFLTGRKPTWSGGPVVGLSIYDRPWLDFLVEGVVVIVCCTIYVRSVKPDARWKTIAVPIAGLLLLQLAFNISMNIVV